MYKKELYTTTKWNLFYVKLVQLPYKEYFKNPNVFYTYFPSPMFYIPFYIPKFPAGYNFMFTQRTSLNNFCTSINI